METRIVTVKKPVIIAAIASAAVTILAALLSNADGIADLIHGKAKPELVLVRLTYFPDQKEAATKLKGSLERKRFNVTLMEADKGIDHVKHYSPYIAYRGSNKDEAELAVRTCEASISRKLEPHSGDDIAEGVMFVVLTSTAGAPEKSKAEQVGTGQPATRSQSKSEGSDKPQPEAEGRSR